MTSPDTEAARVAEIAGKLTKALAGALVEGRGSKVAVNRLLKADPCLVSGVTYHTGFARIRKRTEIGEQVRAHLLTKEAQNGR